MFWAGVLFPLFVGGVTWSIYLALPPPVAERELNVFTGHWEERVGSLDLRNHRLDHGEMAAISGYRHLFDLRLPDQDGLRVDLSSMENLSKLSGRPEALGGLEDVRPSGLGPTVLELHRPGDWLGRLPDRAVYAFARLRLKGEVTSLAGLGAFPWLHTLSLEERFAVRALPTLPAMWNNLELVIESADAPDLGWLSGDLTRYVIHLTAAPDAGTRNLDRFDRVILRGDGLDPEVLARLTGARWIMLEVFEPKPRSWYGALARGLRRASPGLKTFGMAVGPWQWEPDTGRRSVGVEEGPPAEMIALLETCAAGSGHCPWMDWFERWRK